MVRYKALDHCRYLCKISLFDYDESLQQMCTKKRRHAHRFKPQEQRHSEKEIESSEPSKRRFKEKNHYKICGRGSKRKCSEVRERLGSVNSTGTPLSADCGPTSPNPKLPATSRLLMSLTAIRFTSRSGVAVCVGALSNSKSCFEEL
jgi:hypothetical protein